MSPMSSVSSEFCFKFLLSNGNSHPPRFGRTALEPTITGWRNSGPNVVGGLGMGDLVGAALLPSLRAALV